MVGYYYIMYRKVMSINVVGWRGRHRPKKLWMEYIKEEMREKVVN